MTTVLTGATGFLGSRLLYGLLVHRKREVVVIGRGSASELRARVVRLLTTEGGTTPAADVLARLHCLPGDVTRPRLGLQLSEYGRLARRAEAVWHCAAEIALVADLERLRQVNVEGTRQVLAFAAATRPDCPVVHVSTAFVAGRRREGCIAEGDLDASYGFETPYEQSKFEAELLVREWAARHGRRVIVMRPGILVTDRHVPEWAPQHPLGTLGQRIDQGLGARPTSEAVLVRVPVSATADSNVVQVEYAAEAMLRLAEQEGTGAGVRTCHVVHPVNTGTRRLFDAIELRHPGVKVTAVEELPDPDPIEELLAVRLPDLLAYGMQARTYDRSGLLAAAPDLPDPPDIDERYLADALGCGPGASELY